jgi:ABC-type multidrug transport system ATPase subunit
MITERVVKNDSESKNVLEVKGLTKRYGEVTAVDGIDLEVHEGEIFGLVGLNGAGKTSTLMMLSTMRKPTSGTARVNGYDILMEPSEVRRSIGMVF